SCTAAIAESLTRKALAPCSGVDILRQRTAVFPQNRRIADIRRKHKPAKNFQHQRTFSQAIWIDTKMIDMTGGQSDLRVDIEDANCTSWSIISHSRRSAAFWPRFLPRNFRHLRPVLS
ncbi:hypothetical protein, partial [Roseibium sp.]|uniref:hypothetical protein n=1 Tax=Roseibium sp. TaxID=1936156 RepID=UPI003A97494E